MAIANESHVLYEGGDDDLTFNASAAVTGQRFIKISGNALSSSATLNSAVDGSNVRMAHATAAGSISGVSGYDVASGSLGICHTSGCVVEVVASAAVAAGAQVEVATGGKSATLASGIAVGEAYSAASGVDVVHYVRLY